MHRISANPTSVAALLAALVMAGTAPATAEVNKDLRPTYLACPDARSGTLVLSNDSSDGLSVQMKITPGWMHLGVRRPGSDEYHPQLWSEIAKIDQVSNPRARGRLQRAVAQYRELMSVCSGPTLTEYLETLERNRQAVKPRWLALGRPWPLQLTEKMKAILPADPNSE